MRGRSTPRKGVNESACRIPRKHISAIGPFHPAMFPVDLKSSFSSATFSVFSRPLTDHSDSVTHERSSLILVVKNATKDGMCSLLGSSRRAPF